MMVHVQSSLDPPPVAIELIEGAATAALEHETADGELTVVLTDDAQLQRLNRDYLGIDAPTDVLAFPAAETDPDSGVKYLGDVLISLPKAEDQARAAGHPLASEVQLLVVHGALHLLGHDHAQTAAKSRMWAAQDAVLRRLGLDGIVMQDT
jgi:probable rRNA maturation factor